MEINHNCKLITAVDKVAHRDDKNIKSIVNSDGTEKNDGNFRALLRFRIDAGDNDLRKHLEAAPANAALISKTIQIALQQETIISCCKEEI
ncbi:unnamed protein product [Diabrotica balteata]|uniref:Uncharacterized protein n=1 Tax=Diabrotica balteata TaxID=107213 RepID=A0A9N9SUI0_DIABA|nr:unnamed protein product [Diabrotica balteata]